MTRNPAAPSGSNVQEIAVSMKTVTISEFHATLRAQGDIGQENLAFKCPICGTIQSARSLIQAGAGATFDDVEKFLGFSCVGRFTDAGPYKKERAQRVDGCDWTLGGFFKLHCFEVIDEDGKKHPRFEPVDADQAKALAATFGAGRLALRQQESRTS